MKETNSSIELPRGSKKEPVSLNDTIAKLEKETPSFENFDSELDRFKGMGTEMRNKAIQNKGIMLERKSGQISEAISKIDAQLQELDASKDASLRITLGAQRKTLDGLQNRIDEMILKLDALSAADASDIESTTNIPTTEHKNVPRDELSPFFDDMVPERTENGITYGEFSSATAAECEKEHFAKELITDIGNVYVMTNMGGKESKYQSNEDTTFAISEKNRVVFSAIDGMGGGGHGKIAGRLVASVLEKTLRTTPGVSGLTKSRDEIIKQFHENPLVAGKVAGACGVVAEITKNTSGDFSVNAMFAGDSKMLTIQDGAELPEGTTKTQNQVMESLERQFKETGKDNRHLYFADRYNNLISGSFTGSGSQKLPEIISFIAKPGARSILASDGFWDNISHYEVIKISEEYPDDDEGFQAALFTLAMDRNNSAGTKFDIAYGEENGVVKTTPKKLDAGDNVTIAVVRYGDPSMMKIPKTKERPAEADESTTNTRTSRRAPEAFQETSKLAPLSSYEIRKMQELTQSAAALQREFEKLSEARKLRSNVLITQLEKQKSEINDRAVHKNKWQRLIRLDFRSDDDFKKMIDDIDHNIGNLAGYDPEYKQLNEKTKKAEELYNATVENLNALKRRAQANKQ